jgi:membrane protease YdiL (CAAX protease family)
MGTRGGGARDLAVSGKLVAWLTLVGAISAIGYADRVAGGKPPKDVVYRYSTAASELVLFGVILLLVLWIARGLPKREVFALRPPRSWGRAVGLAFGVFVAIWIVSLSLEPLLHPGREQGLAPPTWEPRHAAAFALNVFALALVGPVVEELTFRGLGFTLLQRYGQAVAIVLVGIAFALWHGLIEALPVLFVFGAGLALIRSRSRSIYPCMILHALFNGLALAIAVTI